MNGEPSPDDLYRDAADKYGSALERLARAYEADPEKRRDLIQEIHFQLWRSFQRFDVVTGFVIDAMRKILSARTGTPDASRTPKAPA